MTAKTKTLKALLATRQFIAAPGVFDLISAKIADRTEAKALYWAASVAPGLLARYMDRTIAQAARGGKQ